MDRSEIIKTGNILGLASLVAFLVFSIQWLLWVTFFFLLGNLWASPLHHFIAWLWMKFAYLVGAVNSRILLSLVFYVVLTPLAFLRRLCDHDLKTHFRGKRSETYFETLGRCYERDDFEKLW